jgi:hypothetical protein
MEGLDVIRSCFRGWPEGAGKGFLSEQGVWQACATFGRFQPFGKTLAGIAVYISATIDKGFASARP